MTTKFNSTEYKMIMWSFDFIKHHLNDTTEQLPNELIRFWSIPNFTTDSNYDANNMQLMVFMYILRLHKYSKRKADSFMNTFRFKQLFYNFQVILATTAYCRKAKIEVEPFPIFNIEAYKLPDLANKEELLKMYESITKRQVIG